MARRIQTDGVCSFSSSSHIRTRVSVEPRTLEAWTSPPGPFRPLRMSPETPIQSIKSNVRIHSSKHTPKTHVLGRKRRINSFFDKKNKKTKKSQTSKGLPYDGEGHGMCTQKRSDSLSLTGPQFSLLQRNSTF